jgi:dTDP-4-amino-4,6-dideoxygalactose transaminase
LASGCGDMSMTLKIIDKVLTVPLHLNMKPEFVERIVDGITTFFSKTKVLSLKLLLGSFVS